MRSFDQRSHSYLGYILRIRGTLAAEAREFAVALGKGAYEKHHFRVGDRVSGAGESVADSRLETADIYKASGLKIIENAGEAIPSPPPFLGIAPALEVYRERGHRRLAATTYSTKCTTCGEWYLAVMDGYPSAVSTLDGMLKPQTVHHILSDVRCLLRYAVDAGEIVKAPWRRDLMPRIAEHAQSVDTKSRAR